MVEMNYVDSSNIEAIGYDTETLNLYVNFLGGGSYVYHDVPQYIFEGLMNALSKGSYLNREVKGVYQFTRN